MRELLDESSDPNARFTRDLWDRPSLDMTVRPNKMVRKISRRDLLMPKGPSKLKMLTLTFVGGVSMSLLYVWPPLMIVVLISSAGIGAAWIWLTVGITAAVFWVTLFTLAVHESAADRRYGEQLGMPG